MTRPGVHWWLAPPLLLLILCHGCGKQPEEDFLKTAWQAYKQTFIKEPGYVWDRSRDGGEVTSEGQSYALLRAAWMRDRETFQRVFQWTEANLLREDGLYSWRWSPEQGGRILDANTATDADMDIAFALIVAAEAFDEPDYLRRAKELLVAVRRRTAIGMPGGWVPAAGNWAVDERVVNISYFAPYAHPYFHRLDPEGGWLRAREVGYGLLRDVVAMSEAGLIADFVVVDGQGKPSPVRQKHGLSSDFSFDAMRTYWRVALDCMLHDHLRACADPANTSAMAELLAREGRIYARYSLSGEPRSEVVSLSFYGSLLPGFKLFHPKLAQALRKDQLSEGALRPLLDNPDRYYDLNWVWFGLAAVRGLIQSRTPAPGDIAPPQ